MLNLFASDVDGKTILERLPNIVPINEAQVVRAFLLENGLSPSPDLATRTVREVVSHLTDNFLCINTWELCGGRQLDLHGAGGQGDIHLEKVQLIERQLHQAKEMGIAAQQNTIKLENELADLDGANADAPASVATSTGSGEIYMFEQCTSKVAMATQETLVRRPEAEEDSAAANQQVAMAEISEGTPPSPSPSTAATVPVELDTWLMEAGLDKFADAIKDYGYETMPALQVASEQDIVEMCADADVGMKKPMQKLMLVKWRELKELVES